MRNSFIVRNLILRALWKICLYTGFYLEFFVRGGVDPEKIFEPRGGEKNLFRRSRGSGGMLLPENFENIVFRIG